MEKLNINEMVHAALNRCAERKDDEELATVSVSGGNTDTEKVMKVGHGKLEQMIALLGNQLPSDQFLRYLISFGDVLRQRGELTRAEEIYTIALAHGELHGERSALGEALIRRGDVYCQLGRWKQSNADLTLGRKIYRSLNEEYGITHAESLLAINYAVGGDVKRAKTYLKRTLDSCDRLYEKQLAGVAQMNLGVVYRILGDHDSALSQFQRARSSFEEVGDVTRLAEVHYKIGTTLVLKKAHAEALREFELCGSFSESANNRKLMGLSFLGKASATFSLGDFRIALVLADQALDHFSIHDDRVHLAEVYRLKGAIHRAMKRIEFAHWYLYTSLKINMDLENAYGIGDCYFELGKLHSLRRRRNDAKRAFRKSVECFRKGGALTEVKRVTAELHKLEGKG